MATTMSALMVDGCADGNGLVVCAIAAAIGVRRRYYAADGNSNGFVGEVRWMIAVMMATAMSALMVTAMSMCCVNGDGNVDVGWRRR
jgi:hypothetical protein